MELCFHKISSIPIAMSQKEPLHVHFKLLERYTVCVTVWEHVLVQGYHFQHLLQYEQQVCFIAFME
jgi:hypothetical protein